VELQRPAAVRRGLRLEAVTVAWMLVEAVVALGAAVAARSVLLAAFGFDSIVELLSGIVLYRRLQVESSGASPEAVDRLEARTTAISAVLLILLCAFVVLSSIGGLLLRIEPEGRWSGSRSARSRSWPCPPLRAPTWGEQCSAAHRWGGHRRDDQLRLPGGGHPRGACRHHALRLVVGAVRGRLALLIWLVPEARKPSGWRQRAGLKPARPFEQDVRTAHVSAIRPSAYG
jgi:hypothetical protein